MSNQRLSFPLYPLLMTIILPLDLPYYDTTAILLKISSQRKIMRGDTLPLSFYHMNECNRSWHFTDPLLDLRLKGWLCIGI